ASASDNLERIDALHEFRIRTKTIRYTLESLASALPESARETLYPHISALQESLGVINDHAVAVATLEEFVSLHKRTSKLAAWAAKELPKRHAALNAAHATFLDVWPRRRDELLAECRALGLTH